MSAIVHGITAHEGQIKIPVLTGVCILWAAAWTGLIVLQVASRVYDAKSPCEHWPWTTEPTLGSTRTSCQTHSWSLSSIPFTVIAL